jgi:hypothetical protein
MDNIINQVLFKQQGQGVLGNQYKLFYDEEQDDEQAALQQPGQAKGNKPQELLAPTVNAPANVGAPAAAGQAAPGQAPVDTVQGPAGAVPVAGAAAAPGGAGNAAAIVADEIIKKGKSMKPAEITQLLGSNGIQAREVEIDGKKGVEILDQTGNVVNRLRDTDGDGNIGGEDKEFLAELKKIGYANMDAVAGTRGEQGKKALAAVNGGETATAGDRQGVATAGAKAAPGVNTVNPLDPTKKTEENVNAIGGPENKVQNQEKEYKFQVTDNNLKNCPKGKPGCTGCGDCPKGDIFKQLKAQGTLDQVMKGGGDPATVQQIDAVQKPKAGEGIGGPQKGLQQALKSIQAELTAAGFVDKTAEELYGEGQLKEIAGQLGLYIPESLF